MVSQASRVVDGDALLKSEFLASDKSSAVDRRINNRSILEAGDKENAVGG